MEVTTLARLIDEGCVSCAADALTITITPSFIVAGEDRLSYTSLIRLIEGCREYHWQADIAPLIKTTSLDTICRSLTAQFVKVILVGTTVRIEWKITEVRNRAYTVRFDVRDARASYLCAQCDLVSVFYDPQTHAAVTPPKNVLDFLVKLSQQ